MQVAGSESRAAESEGRDDGAMGRLARIARIAGSFHKKCYFASTSALSSSSYGYASGPLPVKRLEDIRRTVKQATLRGPKFASSLAYFCCLGLPWRLDAAAQALVAPWFVLHRAYSIGRLTPDKLTELWAKLVKDASGPFAAAGVGLKRAGVVGDWRRLVGATGEVLDEPLTVPRAALSGYLLRQHELVQCRRLAGSRRTYDGIQAGVDHWSMKRATGRAGLSAEQAGALRAVRVGNHCTQTKAAHWQGGCTKCRFCGAPREDPFHRFWICPRWDPVRKVMLAGLTVAKIAAEAPRALLEHGLLPVAGVLERARKAAESPAEWVGLDPEGAPRIYTDGSAVFPGDP